MGDENAPLLGNGGQSGHPTNGSIQGAASVAHGAGDNGRQNNGEGNADSKEPQFEMNPGQVSIPDTDDVSLPMTL